MIKSEWDDEYMEDEEILGMIYAMISKMKKSSVVKDTTTRPSLPKTVTIDFHCKDYLMKTFTMEITTDQTVDQVIRRINAVRKVVVKVSFTKNSCLNNL